MWLFTKYGFYSAVSARKGDGSRAQGLDPDRIMVRARDREHLEKLRDRFTNLLGPCEIHEYSASDYAFRIFVDKSVWSGVVAELAGETTYDNFKAEVARHQGASGAAYEQSLHSVWSIMHKLQNRS